MAHRMTTYERGILFDVMAGEPDVVPILNHICLLPFNRKGEFFRYCLAKGIKGKLFVEKFHECKRSPAKFYAKVINELDKHMSTPLSTKDMN